MGMFWPVVWPRIRRDKVKIRGSYKTKRLKKKRRKHLNELYEYYRDQISLERNGLTFMQWKEKNDKERAEKKRRKLLRGKNPW